MPGFNSILKVFVDFTADIFHLCDPLPKKCKLFFNLVKTDFALFLLLPCAFDNAPFQAPD